MFPTPGWSLFLGTALFQTAAGAAEGQDFSNNVFSDLAPLLALFGEKFAQQFMSESFGWLDHIIFAMAPLGIITAIVGAIRVGGPGWMRAVIGRARENRATAEVELMSSTSHEVGELWNGQSVVRTLGHPLVKQLVIIRRELNNTKTFGIYTLEAAGRDGTIAWKQYPGPSVWRWVQAWGPSAALAAVLKRPRKDKEASRWQSWPLDSDDVEKGSRTEGHHDGAGAPGLRNRWSRPKPAGKPSEFAHDLKFEPAPNILLNLHRGSNTGDLLFAAILGIILQIGVLIFSGFVTYFQKFRTKIPGAEERTAAYGYSLLAIGTTLLTFGMMTVSYVIDRSTSEYQWRVNTAQKPNLLDNHETADMRLIWLQKEHLVGDQTFDSFALQAQDDCRQIFTSRRSRGLADSISRETTSRSLGQSNEGLEPTLSPRTRTEALTLFGTIVGLTGFVAQFQGFRTVHWACALAQLSATAIMTLTRAWIRRGLVVRPIATRTTREHEMDWLSENLSSCTANYWPHDESELAEVSSTRTNPEGFWGATFAHPGSFQTKDEADQSHDRPLNYGERTVAVRQRLGVLTNWASPVTKHATAAAAAIKLVMDQLFTHPEFIGKWDRFVWKVDMPLDGRIYQVRLNVEKQLGAKGEGEEWGNLSSEIESLLSLWLFDIKRYAHFDAKPAEESGASGRKSTQHRVGPYGNRWLLRELLWWSDDTPRTDPGPLIMVEGETPTNAKTLSGVDPVLGYRGVRPHTKHSGTHSQLSFVDHAIPYKHYTLVINSDKSQEQRLAQHLFAGFMLSVAHLFSSNISSRNSVKAYDDFNVLDRSSWHRCGFGNPVFSDLIENVQATGIGSRDEIRIFIITALHCAEKLGSHKFVNLIQEKVQHNQKNNRWDESVKAYSELMAFVKAGVGIPDSFVYNAIAVVIEFLITAEQSYAPWITTPANLGDRAENRWTFVEPLRELRESLLDDSSMINGRTLRAVSADLRKLYTWQSRSGEYDRLFSRWSLGLGSDQRTSDFQEENRLIGLFGYSKCHVSLVKKHDDRQLVNWDVGQLRSGDILGWTPLHYAAVLPHGSSFYKKYTNMRHNTAHLPDLNGRTPLHYAARFCSWKFGDFLRKHGKLDARGRDGLLPLHWAAKCGNLLMTKIILRHEERQVNALDYCQRSPLHHAVSEEHESIVKALLDCRDAKPDLGAKLLDGDTVLHMASRRNNSSIIQMLLEFDAALLNEKGAHGRTPLHHACQENRSAVVRVLLEHDATISPEDESGDTPLIIAARNGNVEIISQLVCKDADINRENRREILAHRPLMLATISGNHQAVEVLLEAGADLALANCYGCPIQMAWRNSSVMRILLKYGKGKPELDHAKKDALERAIGNHEADEEVVQMLQEDLGLPITHSGRAPLHKAAKSGDIESVRKLLDGGADINVACNSGETPLSLAVLNSREEVVSLMLARNAEILQACDRPGETCRVLIIAASAESDSAPNIVKQLLTRDPSLVNLSSPNLAIDGYDISLHAASRKGNLIVVKLLLDHKADPLVSLTISRDSSLHIAARFNRHEILALLLDSGGHLGMLQENIKGETPLNGHYPSMYPDTLRIMLQHPLNNNWQHAVSSKTGCNPLHHAARSNAAESIGLLLDAGVDKNAENFDGDTPLHVAAYKSRVEAVVVLMEGGVDVHAKNKAGLTALEMVRDGKHDYVYVVEMLKKAMGLHKKGGDD